MWGILLSQFGWNDTCCEEMFVLMELKKQWPKAYFPICISCHAYFSSTVLLSPFHPLATSNYHMEEMQFPFGLFKQSPLIMKRFHLHWLWKIEVFVSIMTKSELKLYFHLKNTSYTLSHMSHVSVLGKSSFGFPFHRVQCSPACREFKKATKAGCSQARGCDWKGDVKRKQCGEGGEARQILKDDGGLW